MRIALLTIYFTCCSIPTEERKQGNLNAAAYADKNNPYMSPSLATQQHVVQQVCVTLGSVELWVSSSLEVLCGFWGGLWPGPGWGDWMLSAGDISI